MERIKVKIFKVVSLSYMTFKHLNMCIFMLYVDLYRGKYIITKFLKQACTFWY